MKKYIFALLVVLIIFATGFPQIALAAPCPNDPGKLCNPLDVDSLQDLAVRVGSVVRDLAIPIAVIIIIWAGIQFLIAGGNTERISKAKKALLWAIVGLAIIFIGSGFIDLIKDILSLKDR